MPGGVPVATVALNASLNAAILACQIIATADENVANMLSKYKEELKEKVVNMNRELNAD
jgi:5-(carboxyamino)imidazole ribonucleotide mutase